MKSRIQTFFLAGLLGLSSLQPAWAWLGPSLQAPYAVVVAPIDPAKALSPSWNWVDARPAVEMDNRATRDGYHFGDGVIRPRPFDFVQAEFLRQVALHDERATLLEKLGGKTIRLLEFESIVGLWIRLTETQNGKWETVRVRLVIDVDGNRYEAGDSQPFHYFDKPSPVNAPMRATVESLVNQIALF